jgi:carbon monoxide dehydrogenase subunit G
MTFQTSRHISASPEQVFAAFQDPARLARWWGPAGFSNTFKICEFRAGGRWSFTMHSQDGKNYQNDSIFEEIEPNRKVVILHGSLPKYRLSIGLAPAEGGTLLSWSQAFDDAKVAKAIEHIVVPSNEQNIDRLVAELQGR